MVESLMLIALGFMSATFIGILLSQFIWRRAVTVTTRRLQESNISNELEDAGDEANAVALQATQQELGTLQTELAASKDTIASLQTVAQDETAQKGALTQGAEHQKQEVERLTNELTQSESQIEAAKGALSEAEAKILALSSDATAKTKEVADLTETLAQSKQDAETAETSRLKTEDILTNVSAAAFALVATLPATPDQEQTEKQEEEEEAEEPEKSGEPEKFKETPLETIAAPKLLEAPETDITSAEVISVQTPSETESVRAKPETNPATDENLPALVAAIPTLDEFAAKKEDQPFKSDDTELTSEDTVTSAPTSTLDARIEALKEGVSSPA